MSPIRVLLADDNHEFRRRAAALLARYPRVKPIAIGAASGEEAIALSSTLQPDLILMDMLMPGMDGLEAIRRIKAGPGAPQIVVLTLHDNPEARVQSVAAGADGFMAKVDFGERVGDLIDELFPGPEWDMAEGTRQQPAPALPPDVERLHRMAVLGEVALGLAHDLGSLLGVVGVAASGLRRRLRDDPRSHEYTDAITQAVDAGGALIKRVIAAAHGSASPEPTDVSVAVAELVPLLSRSLPEEIGLVVDLDPMAGEVDLPGGLLEQMLLNLVLNARDATAAGGRITLRTAAIDVPPGGAAEPAPGRYVTVSVGDTGTGMTEQTRARLFEPFFTTRPDRGAGLGLSLVRSAVQAIGGSITVDSQPGAGSRFTVYLPVTAGGYR